jgi:hypothetical protein
MWISDPEFPAEAGVVGQDRSQNSWRHGTERGGHNYTWKSYPEQHLNGNVCTSWPNVLTFTATSASSGRSICNRWGATGK